MSVKDHISKEAEAVLIEEFHNGELKGGDRQSCFQMEQSLRIKFSSNVANSVDRYSIQSWLSTYIDRRKKENDPLYQWEVRRKQVTSTMMRGRWGCDPSVMNVHDLKDKVMKLTGMENWTLKSLQVGMGSLNIKVSKDNLKGKNDICMLLQWVLERNMRERNSSSEGERKHEGSAAKKRRIFGIEESVSEFLNEVKERICQECGPKPGANSIENSSSRSSNRSRSSSSSRSSNRSSSSSNNGTL